ncbi:MAG: hypothetical protein F4213_08485 [Boseongicola sp. SB0677_bin_26]|nr:hypothetical protein [Boseongicola sp. SB0665_bin_10]MYG26048.1 hypothetical protein [Boseongicola sp. SB0677_bin_26]
MTGLFRSIPLLIAIAGMAVHAKAQVGVFQDVLGRITGEAVPAAVSPGARKRLLDLCRHPAELSHDIRTLDPVHVVGRPEGVFGDDPLVDGIAVLEYGYSIELAFTAHDDATLSCLRLDGLHVISGDAAPEIWLSPHLDRCEHGLTLAHELQHVIHYQDHLRRFRGLLDRELDERLGGRSWTWVQHGDVDGAEARLTEHVSDMVDALNRRSRRHAMMLDEELDSPESYRTLFARCRKLERSQWSVVR